MLTRILPTTAHGQSGGRLRLLTGAPGRYIRPGPARRGVMDTLVMHRTLTDAGMSSVQADAVIKVIQGGVATKQDLDMAVLRLERRIDGVEGRIERLENKVNLLVGVAILAVLAPALTRLIIGS